MHGCEHSEDLFRQSAEFVRSHQACRVIFAAGFKKIGDQLTQEWLAKAGPDGQAVIDSYRKM